MKQTESGAFSGNGRAGTLTRYFFLLGLIFNTAKNCSFHCNHGWFLWQPKNRNCLIQICNVVILAFINKLQVLIAIYNNS